MRTTVSLDDQLVDKAMALSAIEEKPALIREALTALIEREAAKRLAQLAGSDASAAAAPRPRPE